MFRWHKEIDRLDIPAAKVYHLERSLSAVQVALPGVPSQEATAYLCVYSPGKGLRAALVLHLLTSRRLAFYLHDEENVPQQEVSRLINAGADFAESLGFMLSDVDFRKLEPQRRAALWGSLPLKNGIETAAPPPAVPPDIPQAEASPPPAVPAAIESSSSSAQLDVAIDEMATELLEEPELPEDAEGTLAFAGPELSEAPEPSAAFVIETVAEAPEPSGAYGEPATAEEKEWTEAFEAPERQGESMLQPPAVVSPPTANKPPGAEDLQVRRQKLLEGLGRFLASL